MNALPPFRKLSASDPNAAEMLGPLFDMTGTWTNAPGLGWNLIAVPGPLKGSGDPNYFNSYHGFILETIPYIETITFEPISVTLNRGQFPIGGGFGSGGEQEIQQIGALLYEQTIVSAGVSVLQPSDPNYAAIEQFFAQRGFAQGTPIHAERGMLLNLTNFNSYGLQNFPIARMGTIPHGNAMLCLGGSETITAPDIDPFGTNALPTSVDPTRPMPVEYTINTYASPSHSLSGYPFYPMFTPANPNQTLINANEGVNFKSTNHLQLDTQNGTGGLLSIPFVGGGIDRTKIDTNKMSVDYWISTLQDGSKRLQYVQNINLIFPTNLDPSLPINWPHIGLNTLTLKK